MPYALQNFWGELCYDSAIMTVSIYLVKDFVNLSIICDGDKIIMANMRLAFVNQLTFTILQLSFF